jgi:hypothetical protein
MDAVPIVPIVPRTKNTTVHELQTHDRSRATDTPGRVELTDAAFIGDTPNGGRDFRMGEATRASMVVLLAALVGFVLGAAMLGYAALGIGFFFLSFSRAGIHSDVGSPPPPR